MHAGLLAGITGENANIPVVGISIRNKKDIQRETVYSLCQKAADKLEMKNRPAMDDVIVFDDYIGPGYARPSEAMIEAVKLVARTEAILLDPVYTGKTMAGLMDLSKKGYFGSAKNILFIHAGGSPALYAHTKEFF
jgi:D-cysteine desulfhydrase